MKARNIGIPLPQRFFRAVLKFFAPMLSGQMRSVQAVSFPIKGFYDQWNNKFYE